MHHTRKRQVFPVSIGPELNFVSLCFVNQSKVTWRSNQCGKHPLRLWRTIQAEGSTERDWRRVVTRVIDAQSRRTCRFPSPRRRAKHCDTGGMPGSVWLHFEEASTTLLQFRVNTQLEKVTLTTIYLCFWLMQCYLRCCSSSRKTGHPETNNSTWWHNLEKNTV